MIYAIYIALALVAFLIVLNEFLRGAWKDQIDAVLSLLLLGFVIAAFVVAGWKLGLIAIGIALLSAALIRPIAARIASRLLSVSTRESAGYVGLPAPPLEKISQQLGRQIDSKQFVKEMLGGSDRRGKAESALFDYCESQFGIKSLMMEFQVSRDDLKELYFELVAAGAGQWACGHWVAASALAYPESLHYVLARRRKDIRKTAAKLIMYFEQGIPLEE